MWARKQGTASWTWGVKSPLQDDEGAALHERLVGGGGVFFSSTVSEFAFSFAAAAAASQCS
jgi:hypothetical protein